MKKFAKVSLITAGILLLTGCLLGTVSAIAGGSSLIRIIREEEDLDVKVEHFVDSVGNRFYYLTDGRWGYTKNEAGSTTFTETAEQISSEGIRNIELALGAGTFIIEEKEAADGVIEISISGIGDCDYFVEGDTLHMEGFKGLKWTDYNNADNNRIEVRVPKGSSFDEVDIETGASMMEISNIRIGKLDATVGAGALYLQNMEMEKLSAEIGAGQMEVSGITVKDAEFDVGVGECIFGGAITGKLDVECGMGNMEFMLKGHETDHNYEIECGAGSIQIGSFSISALAAEKLINNNAASKFDIECNMGNVTIEFED